MAVKQVLKPCRLCNGTGTTHDGYGSCNPCDATGLDWQWVEIPEPNKPQED